MVRYGYDKFLNRGYYIGEGVKNIERNRLYIWKSYDGWQLYRFTYDRGVARNTPLLEAGVKKNQLRKAAEGVR